MLNEKIEKTITKAKTSCLRLVISPTTKTRTSSISFITLKQTLVAQDVANTEDDLFDFAVAIDVCRELQISLGICIKFPKQSDHQGNS